MPASRPMPATPAIWIDRPWIDLLIGCGGWSVPLLLVAYTLIERDIPRWSALFYGLALVCNYPHYMATIYRAYGRDDRGSHRLYTHGLTAALVAIGLAAHARVALVPWLFTAYVMWSPWHYSGQNFGLSMMFLRRAGLDVSADERQRLHIAFIASYVMLLAAFNAGASQDPLVLSIGLPAVAARAIQIGAAIVFVLAGLTVFVPLARRATAASLIAPMTLFSTQALWFVVPVALSWAATLSAPQTRYSSGMLAVMHSAQYLWITRYFARRDAERGPHAAPWNGRAYWGTLIVGGLALFLPIPWLASYGWHVDFTTSVLIVAAVVNLHHFMIDGVVWKLRHQRVGRVLVGGHAGPRETDAGEPLQHARASEPRTWFARSWRIASVGVLVTLAAIDQWRYQMAVGRADRESLTVATRLNPYDSPAFLRLAQAAGETGDTAAAEAALRRAAEANPQNPAPTRRLLRLLIDLNRLPEAYALSQSMLGRWPADVETLVNAGVLAYRLGDPPAAEGWWRRALERQDSLPRVQLYLAEILDARGRSGEAVRYYRRYLEIVAATGGAERPAPHEVIPVVVKFGDALAREGQPDVARTQYDLAIRMARQTGLTDLEALAQARRAALAP